MASKEQLIELHRIACTYGGPFEAMATKAIATGDLDQLSEAANLTMLEIAIHHKNLRAVTVLLDAGANPNHHGKNGANC